MRRLRVRVQRAPDLAKAFGPWGERQPRPCGDPRHAKSGCECFAAWRDNPRGYANGKGG